MSGNFIDELFYPGNIVQVEYREKLLSKIVLLTSVQSTSEASIHLLLKHTDADNLEPIKPGTGLALSAREKSTTQIYYYTSELIDFQPSNPALLTIKRPPLSQTTSRRNFFRCDVEFPFYFRVEDQIIKGQAGNLSASGLFGVIKENPGLKPGNLIPIELSLPTLLEPIALEAKIIRIHQIDPDGVWGIALHFNNPKEKNQNDIIKYLFQRQRELIQKGQIKIGTIQ